MSEDLFAEVRLKKFESCFFILLSEFGTEYNIKTHRRNKGTSDFVMPDSTMDYLEENGYVLDYGDEGQVHIECPFADEHTTESAISSTSYFPAGSRGYKRGNFICLHAHCEGRKNLEFENALGVTAASFQDLSFLGGRQRFEVIPVGEFISIPTPPWLIKGILPENGLAMIYGASGSGKSFLAIDIAGSIARGVEWCGRKTKQGSVVYIAAEGVAGIRKRFEAYAKYYGLNANDLPIGVIQDAPNLHHNDYAPLVKAIKSHGEVRVIVVDTLAQVTPGADENSGKDMGDFLGKCRKIQEETGALVILIHHSGKDEARGARGWSGLFAAMDTVIKVSANQQLKKAVLTKQKDGEGGLEFPFKLQQILLGWDEDDEEITSCIVVYTAPEGKTVEIKGKWQKSIIQVMQELEQNEEPVLIQDLISKASEHHPFEPGDDPAKPRRDRRVETLQRALKQIVNLGFLFVDGDNVIFPQSHKGPKNG